MLEIDFNFTAIFLMIAIGFIIFLSVKIVPQQEAWIIERLGKYKKTLQNTTRYET